MRMWAGIRRSWVGRTTWGYPWRRRPARYIVNQPTVFISNSLTTFSANRLVYELPGVLRLKLRPGIRTAPSPVFASGPDSMTSHVCDATIRPLVTRFTGGLCAPGNRMTRHPCYTRFVYIGAITDVNRHIVHSFGVHRVGDGRLNCGRPLPRNRHLEANDSLATSSLHPELPASALFYSPPFTSHHRFTRPLVFHLPPVLRVVVCFRQKGPDLCWLLDIIDPDGCCCMLGTHFSRLHFTASHMHNTSNPSTAIMKVTACKFITMAALWAPAARNHQLQPTPSQTPKEPSECYKLWGHVWATAQYFISCKSICN